MEDLFLAVAEDIAELRKQTGRGWAGESSIDDGTMSMQPSFSASASDRGSFRLSRQPPHASGATQLAPPPTPSNEHSSGCSC